MKITNATWELRNIGLKVCEIQFGAGDGKKEINKALDSGIFDYYVAKVPSENIALVHDLEERGFRYLENQVNLFFASDEVNGIDKRWIDRFGGYTCTLLQSEEEFNHIIKKTGEGLFEKERFSVDPLINPTLPDIRIAYWIGDIYSRGESLIYLLKKGENIIGFFIIKKKGPGSLYVEMAALFRDYRSIGLSFLLIYNILLIATALEVKSIKASVSTNNIRTINTFTRFINFRIRSVNIVLRKLKSEN